MHLLALLGHGRAGSFSPPTLQVLRIHPHRPAGQGPLHRQLQAPPQQLRPPPQVALPSEPHHVSSPLPARLVHRRQQLVPHPRRLPPRAQVAGRGQRPRPQNQPTNPARRPGARPGGGQGYARATDRQIPRLAKGGTGWVQVGQRRQQSHRPHHPGPERHSPLTAHQPPQPSQPRHPAERHGHVGRGAPPTVVGMNWPKQAAAQELWQPGQIGGRLLETQPCIPSQPLEEGKAQPQGQEYAHRGGQHPRPSVGPRAVGKHPQGDARHRQQGQHCGRFFCQYSGPREAPHHHRPPEPPRPGVAQARHDGHHPHQRQQVEDGRQPGHRLHPPGVHQRQSRPPRARLLAQQAPGHHPSQVRRGEIEEQCQEME